MWVVLLTILLEQFYFLGRVDALAKPYGDHTTKVYYRNLSVLSAKFACLTDIASLLLGGALKRKEMISGRFADSISAMYEISACIKLYEEKFLDDERCKVSS